MKKFAALFIFVLTVLFNIYAYASDTIRVGLYYGSTAPDSVVLSYDGVEATIKGSDLTGEKVYTPKEGTIKVNGKGYRGSIILKKTDKGKITVINEVGIEDYVASVVSKEMSPGFELEALKAQAVCARTYALSNINKHAAHGFGVCAGVDCQVYTGADAEHEKTVKAALETKGEVLTYDGNLAETVYSATSGGYTEDAKYVWGTDIPYLKGVPDEYEGKDCYASTWVRELSPEKATEILLSKGFDIGNVKDIEVLESTKNGAVYKLRVRGDKGEKIFPNESCRTLFGYNFLLSQAYTVTRAGGFSAYAYGGTVKDSGLHILSADGLSEFSGTELYLKGNGEAAVLSASGNFVFNGRGNGHLVGMSQNGANGMAAAGFTYDKILKHYYTGTEITRQFKE